MKIQIESLGCKVNNVEAESIAELFRARGHKIVKRGADIVIINTCCVTVEAESKSRQAIRKALKNGAMVAVMGCSAQLSPNELKEIGVSVIVGTADRKSIVDKVEEAVKNPEPERSAFDKVFGKPAESISFDLPDKYEELPHVPNKTRAFVKIQDGCNGRCTYCVIPKVRGNSRSRSLDSIVEECKSLIDYKEIVLTGINLGMYGLDIGLKLSDAIKAVLKNTNARIRLSSIEPNEVTEDIINLIRDENRICKYLHIPIQSGCDAILQMMHRPYKTAYIEELINKLKTEIPEIAIGTDIINGFPGEDVPMFYETFNFLQKLPIQYFHIFGYSPRKGTIAAEMTQVSPNNKKIRVNKMLALAANKNLEFRKSRIDSEAEVLTETNKGEYTEGHSGDYIKVYIKSNESKIPLNEIVKVKLTDIYKDGMIGMF